MCTPLPPSSQKNNNKNQRDFHALPLKALPPLENYFQIHHNFFSPVSRCTSLSSLKHEAWVRRYFGLKYYAASNGCTHGQCHSENLSLSSAHVYIAPSLWLLMWIDLLVVLQAIAQLCLNYQMQISLCVCGGGGGGGRSKNNNILPTFRPLIQEWCCLKFHCQQTLLLFIESAMSQATCNPPLPDAARVGKIINFTATWCILTLTMPTSPA